VTQPLRSTSNQWHESTSCNFIFCSKSSQAAIYFNEQIFLTKDPNLFGIKDFVFNLLLLCTPNGPNGILLLSCTESIVSGNEGEAQLIEEEEKKKLQRSKDN
jgi:hypothetical protein